MPEHSEKEADLLSQDYAAPCPDCGAVVFEWWDGCRECSGTGARQTTLGDDDA